MKKPLATQPLVTGPIEHVDVIVMSYNFLAFLPDALQGVLAQTRQPDQLILSDDHSPNYGMAELQALGRDFPTVKILRNPENMGAVPHFRERIDALTGDAYLLLSGDDYLVDPDFLADAIQILDDHPRINVVFGHHLGVDQHGRALQAERPAASEPWTRVSGATMRTRLAYENVVPAVCTVIRRSVHAHVPPFPIDHPLRHDWQQWYLMSYHGDFAQIERTVVHYRIHGGNMSVGAEQSRRMAALLAEAYDQLLARPECEETDRAHLQAGRCRLQLRGSAVGQLPGIVGKNLMTPGLSVALAETLAERAGHRLTGAAAKLRRRFLRRQTGEDWRA